MRVREMRRKAQTQKATHRSVKLCLRGDDPVYVHPDPRGWGAEMTPENHRSSVIVVHATADNTEGMGTFVGILLAMLSTTESAESCTVTGNIAPGHSRFKTVPFGFDSACPSDGSTDHRSAVLDSERTLINKCFRATPATPARRRERRHRPHSQG